MLCNLTNRLSLRFHCIAYALQCQALKTHPFWVRFWVSSRKITPLDDVNSFLFNAYSVSSKKVYPIRAPDHPPQTSEKSEVFLFRNVEISTFREWCQLIRSIDRVSLEVLHFSKKCYSPGGAMTAGIFAFMPVLFREVASSLHPVSGRNSS